MAQNEPQRKETPPGPSPNSPSLLFEYQCRSGKFVRSANRIESKKIDSVARIESNRNFFARIGMLYLLHNCTRKCRLLDEARNREASAGKGVAQGPNLPNILRFIVRSS